MLTAFTSQLIADRCAGITVCDTIKQLLDDPSANPAKKMKKMGFHP